MRVPPRLVERHVELAARPDGTLRLAVLADTHSQPHPHTAARLTELAPDAILHAGDIGDLGVLDDLAAHAPVHAVRGNIDNRARDLPDVLLVEVMHEGALRLRILLTHIAVAGPRIRSEVARRARAAEAPLIVCGHSHVPFIGGERGLTVFNPGSIGPRRFALPIVFGLLELGPRGVQLAHLEAETGARWLPPG